MVSTVHDAIALDVETSIAATVAYTSMAWTISLDICLGGILPGQRIRKGTQVQPGPVEPTQIGQTGMPGSSRFECILTPWPPPMLHLDMSFAQVLVNGYTSPGNR